MPTPAAIALVRFIKGKYRPGHPADEADASEIDRFGADRVRDYIEGKPTLQSASSPPNPFRAALQSRLTEIAEEHVPKETGGGDAGERARALAKDILDELLGAIEVDAYDDLSLPEANLAGMEKRIETALRSSHREGAEAMREVLVPHVRRIAARCVGAGRRGANGIVTDIGMISFADWAEQEARALPIPGERDGVITDDMNAAHWHGYREGAEAMREECAKAARGPGGHDECDHGAGYMDGRLDAALAIEALPIPGKTE